MHGADPMRTTLRRDDILQAAAQIFREKGYHAASMRDIAEAVHLQKASLYHHLQSKQELLLELLDRALDLMIEDVTDVLESRADPLAKLRSAMRAYMSRLTSDADLAAVLLLEYRSLQPDLRKEHVQRRDRLEMLWRELLEEGIRAGAFRPVDPAIAGFVLLGVLNWSITWFRPEGRLSADELADRFTELLLAGLAADEHGLGPGRLNES